MMQNGNSQAAGGKLSRGGWFYLMLKGALVGTGAILPGISGGVLCVVFGIYRPLMEMLAHPVRELKENFWFLMSILIGFTVGVLGISKLLQWVLAEAEAPAVWVFVGLIAGTLPSLWREAGREGREPGDVRIGLFTLAVMLVLLLFVKFSSTVHFSSSIWLWMLCGVLWGLGFIAPGLSPSSLFFFMGVMEPMMAGIATLSLPVLLPMGTGLILCVLLLSRGVSWLLKHRYGAISHAVLGLALASTIVILPLDAVHTVTDGLLAALCFGTGFAVALWMDRMNRKMVDSGLKSTSDAGWERRPVE